MLLAPIIWALTVGIVYFFAAKTWWFPPPINQHGMDYDAQFMRTLIVVGIVFTLAQFALGWVIMKFRNDGGKASHSHGNNALETLWTSATAILFLGLVVMGTKIWAGVHFDEAPPDAIPIEVMAKQFTWSFRYPGPDGTFGATHPEMISEGSQNFFGLDPEHDVDSRDDIVAAEMAIPVNKEIHLLMHSKDVGHSFYVRELRVQQDFVPGLDVSLHFTATKVGKYEIVCTQLCGLGHYNMKAYLEVMSQQDFDDWMKKEAAMQ